jgi:hypothetical protein
LKQGRWQGHRIQVALDCGFEQIFSCDIDPGAISLGKKLFGNNPKVKIYDVESSQFLETFFETYNITVGHYFLSSMPHRCFGCNSIDAPSLSGIKNNQKILSQHKTSSL